MTIDLNEEDSALFDGLKPIGKPWYLRIRYQFLLVVLSSVVVPLVFRFGNGWLTSFTSTSLLFSLLATVVAILVTLFCIRRLRQVPGFMSVGYVIITVAVIYGIIAIVFLMLRLDYSRFLLVSSFAISTVSFVLFHLAEKRLVKQHMALVPGGSVKALALTRGVDWHLLSEPENYQTYMGSIVADLRHDHNDAWDRFLTEAAIKGIPVYHYKQIKEGLSGKVEIDHLSENNFGSLIPDHLYLRVKQTIDFFAALVALPLLLFTIAVLAPFIRKDTGGTAIYSQKRIGYRGEKFICYKLRTMRAETLPGNTMVELFSESNDAARTKDNDDRITQFGGFLRKYRIDELPQIFNILRGEMSWIGPRPEAVPLSLEYEKALPFYRYRHIVRPGISGWAQINQGHVTETDQVLEKLHYDFYYIKHLSLALDLMIVIRTILTIFKGFGAR